MTEHRIKKQLTLSDIPFAKNNEGYNCITPDHSILTQRINGQIGIDYQLDKGMSTERSMEYCSRFDSCSAPKCPLDVHIDQKIEIEGDPRCGMAKATRHKYWESMPEDLRKALPFQGYFKGEFHRIMAARERWESLPEDRKSEIRERMRNARQ